MPRDGVTDSAANMLSGSRPLMGSGPAVNQQDPAVDHDYYNLFPDYDVFSENEDDPNATGEDLNIPSGVDFHYQGHPHQGYYGEEAHGIYQEHAREGAPSSNMMDFQDQFLRVG